MSPNRLPEKKRPWQRWQSVPKPTPRKKSNEILKVGMQVNVTDTTKNPIDAIPNLFAFSLFLDLNVKIEAAFSTEFAFVGVRAHPCS